MTVLRLALVAAVTLTAGACASVPPPPAPPTFSYEQKLGWILYLEDARFLRDPEPVAVAAAPMPGARTASAPTAVHADLLELLEDRDARVRRRAAIAIGRVGLEAGVDPLIARLEDPDPDVRTMVAFALGLLGDRRAGDPLAKVLGADPDWRVRGRAAEALGRIGDARHAAAIGRLAAAVMASGAVARVPEDELAYPLAADVEAFRLALYALVRLKAYDQIASVVLDAGGQPLVRWWPVAYALQRVEDRRALPALVALAAGSGPETTAFAARGLGVLQDPAGVDVLLRTLASGQHPPHVMAQVVRALGQIGDLRAVMPLVTLGRQRTLDEHVRLEILNALGALRGRAGVDVVIDQVTARSPATRAAAIRALAAIDPDTFLTVASGLDRDPEWAVRAAQAEALGALPEGRGLAALRLLAADEDARVRAAVLQALAGADAAAAAPLAAAALGAEDEVLRATAARLIARQRPADGVTLLTDAYRRTEGDAGYVARAAVLEALSSFGLEAARPWLVEALGDRQWPVRLKAAALLRQLDPSAEAVVARPAPTRRARADYIAPNLVSPRFSPQAYLQTTRGTIQIELDVVNAPLATDSFISLARSGFFDGLAWHRVVPNFVVQAGDPRGDGEGGPGYTLRDEVSEVPYLRGTVGLALDWADTGGSQFFITHGPQPHLDGRYPVIGRVVAGMDVVDAIQQWDRIERVRIWDGVEFR